MGLGHGLQNHNTFPLRQNAHGSIPVSYTHLISCLVVVFQDVLNQARYRFQIFQTETSLIRIDYHKLITCLELQPSTQKLLNVEPVSYTHLLTSWS